MKHSYDRRTSAVQPRLRSPVPHKKLDSRTRTQANVALDRAGLGGRGRYDKPGLGLSAAWGVLSKFRIEPADMVSGHRLSPAQGSITVDIAFSNEDPFSPTPVHNSMLSFSWSELREGVYECIAYLS